MPENTKTPDHKAEALRLIERGVAHGKESGRKATPDQFFAAALIQSNLAIAEGQERVAEELRNVHQAIDGIAWGMGANAAAAQEARA